MKKKFLSVAIAAGLVGSINTAQAVYVNQDGLGQVLLFPYYTVEGGNNTLINLVNTTDEVKVVKVRILEAMNSQEVLDFNLYLSPYDHWSAAITADPNGEGAVIRTADTSCTVPAALASTVEGELGNDIPFRNFAYSTDKINTGLDRTREGYIEVIDMGTVMDSRDPSGLQLATAATHVNGVPADCAALTASWSSNAGWGGGTKRYMSAPEGGLAGTGVIINVADGTAGSYNATALEAFTTKILNSAPGSLNPSLKSGDKTADVPINNTMVNETTLNGLDAVSLVLLHDVIGNDYVLDPSINAGTDWVITFPTKRDYVAGIDVSGTQTPLAPFTTLWDSTLTQACEPIGITYFDREERSQQPDDLDFSPQPPAAQPLSLCVEANVLTFNGSNVLSGSDRVNKNLELDSAFVDGWMKIDLSASSLSSPAPVVAKSDGSLGDARVLEAGQKYLGLPVIGFGIQKYVNGTLGGGSTLANYAATFKHLGSRAVQ